MAHRGSLQLFTGQGVFRSHPTQDAGHEKSGFANRQLSLCDMMNAYIQFYTYIADYSSPKIDGKAGHLKLTGGTSSLLPLLPWNNYFICLGLTMGY
jgi:hypothetical protein